MGGLCANVLTICVAAAVLDATAIPPSTACAALIPVDAPLAAPPPPGAVRARDPVAAAPVEAAMPALQPVANTLSSLTWIT